MKAWEQYPKLVQAIRAIHDSEGPMFSAHDFYHVIHVAAYCHMIAPDEETGRLAAVAALCHNADRIEQKRSGVGAYGHVPDEKVRDMVYGWLDTEGDTFSKTDRDRIMDAILHHSGLVGDDADLVLITLIDADRIVNTELDCFIRQGAFSPDLPYADPVHHISTPGESFRKPKTHLGTFMVSREEWANPNDKRFCVRLPKALEIIRARLDDARKFAAMVYKQRELAGLVGDPVFN